MFSVALSVGWIANATKTISLDESKNNVKPRLQIVSLKKIGTNIAAQRYVVVLSDSINVCKAVLHPSIIQQNNFLSNLVKSLIIITSYSITNVDIIGRIMIIHSLEILAHCDQIIGSPKPGNNSTLKQQIKSDSTLSIATSSSLSNDMESLWNNVSSQQQPNFNNNNNQQFNGDIKFIVGIEKRVFNAHNIIVSTRSEYFNSLVNNGMLESRNRDAITITNCDSITFERILKWIYTDKLQLPAVTNERLEQIKRDGIVNSDSWKLWEAAMYFCLQPLASLVEQYIYQNELNPETVSSFWSYLYRYRREETTILQKYTQQYFYQNLDSVIASDDLVNLDKDLLIQVFRKTQQEQQDQQQQAQQQSHDNQMQVDLPSTSKTLALTRWFVHNEPTRLKRKLEQVSVLSSNLKKRKIVEQQTTTTICTLKRE